MRRRAWLVLGAMLAACSRTPRNEPSPVAPDPAVASASEKKAAPPAAPFLSKNDPVVLAYGDDVAWIDVDGRIGHTVDGGAHWTWSTVPGPFSYETLSIAHGDGSGWLTVGSGDEKSTKLFRADGAKWIDVTPKLPSTPTGDHYGPIYAFDRDVAFTTRADDTTPQITMLVTHDGGATWKSDVLKTFTPAMRADFFALDHDRVWALVETEHGMSSMPGLLYFTDDGAARGWMTVVPPPPNAGVLSFVDGSRGFLLASEGTTSPPNLWRTEDEGRSWKKIFSDADEIEAMPVFRGDDAVLVAKRFAVTHDGGKTWTRGSARPEGAIGQLGGVLWHVQDALFQRSDGTSWRTRAGTQMLLVGEVTSIAVATERTGWMVVRTGEGKWRVLGTHDVGVTFSSFAPPPK